MNCTFAKLLLSPIIPEVAHEMDCLDRERFLHTVIPKYIHKKNTPRTDKEADSDERERTLQLMECRERRVEGYRERKGWRENSNS